MSGSAVRLIAFYLPQFHPIPENDRWWGKGFTDWIKVVQARPIFTGHYQPHLPADLGFYDLRLEETRIAQAEMAAGYGIHGFCYYHYWFNGQRLLDRPFGEVLKSGKPDFPFCLCWANENWTRRWDGYEQDVLLAQRHSLEDAAHFIRSLFPAFEDPRYIRVRGRPLLLVYRVDTLPEVPRTAELWRRECEKAGVGDPYLGFVESFGNLGRDPAALGFDAAVEFPPHNQAPRYEGPLSSQNQAFRGEIFDYREVARRMAARELPGHPLFRTVMPMWDNTPRRPEGGHIYHLSSPEAYGRWLAEAIDQTRSLRRDEERLVFINAWNEWAEGNHLEPDLKHGRAYLQATLNALTAAQQAASNRGPVHSEATPDSGGTTHCRASEDDLSEKEIPGRRKQQESEGQALTLATVAHLYYPELAESLIGYLRNIPLNFDLYLSTRPEAVAELEALFSGDLPCRKTVIRGVENRGFDIRPCLVEFAPDWTRYDLVCKVHGKKSPNHPQLAAWGSYLLDNLLGSPEIVSDILAWFQEDQKLGLVFPDYFPPMRQMVEWGSNWEIAAGLGARLNLQLDRRVQLDFPAGSMFWFRPKAIKPLLELNLGPDDFEPSPENTVDGTLAHAVERLFLRVVERQGYGWKKTLHRPHGGETPAQEGRKTGPAPRVRSGAGRAAGVSILIPTLNGGKRFTECLSAIQTQEFEGEVQLVVVDSGSTDGTAEAAERAGALVKRIEGKDFHHARTRNQAIELARHPLVLFLVQDALPTAGNWLSRLAASLEEYDATAAYAGQDPHDDAQPYARFEVESHGEHLGASPAVQAIGSREAFAALPYEQAYRVIRMDNVCAIYRKEALSETPFPEVGFAEDMAWARAAMLAGRRILYQPEVRVKHSHNRPAEYGFKRQIVNAVWVARIMGRVPRDLSFLSADGLLGLRKRVEERAGKILNESVPGDSENGKKRKQDFAVGSLLRHADLPLQLRIRFPESRFFPWKRPAEEVSQVAETVTREMDYWFGVIRNRYALTGKEDLFELLDQVSAMSLGKIFGQAYVCHWLKGSRMNGLAALLEKRWMDL